MLEIFYGTLLIDLVALLVLVPLLITINRRYSISLDKLIDGLPEPAYEKLKEQSREKVDSIKSYFKENLKAQFNQPDFLINLITSKEFDSFGVKELREECNKNYRKYKNVFLLNAILFLYLALAALGISVYFG